MSSPTYKKYLKDIVDYNFSLNDIIERAARPGTLFRIKSEKDDRYNLVFNKQINSPITVPLMSDEDILYAPYFYLDDDNIVLDVRQVLALTLLDRFEYMHKSDFKFKYAKYLRKDIVSITKTNVNIMPFSYNNKIKLRNRVRVIKTYKTTKKGDIKYYDCFGMSLWDSAVPTDDEDIKRYSKIFKVNPISVVGPSAGMYELGFNDQYSAPGYYSDDKKIISIFPNKSNIPERLRLHYTSEYLEPLEPESDFLLPESFQKEKKNAIIVFLPIENEFYDDIKDSPLGSYTLGAGEVLINETLAEEQYYIRRTFNTESTDSFIVKEGTVVNPGDVLAWDSEGFEEVIYDLKYENAVVEKVIKGYNQYKIVLKIVSNLGTARIISEYGIKAVTHPRKNLGKIILPEDMGSYEFDVSMISGPTSMKSGINGVKLSWLALKQMLAGTHYHLDPNVVTSQEVDDLVKDIKQVDWVYRGKTYKVYAGIMSFGVTDLAKDCKSDYVRVMPETLKYMYTSGNESMAKAADMLIEKYVSTEDKWTLDELLKLREDKIVDTTIPVLEYNNPDFVKYLSSSYFSISSFSDMNNKLQSTMLLNDLNLGFYIKFEDRIIRMPSAKLIKYMTFVMLGNINYPIYYEPSLFLLMSLRSFNEGKIRAQKVVENINRYINNVNVAIFSKKNALSRAVSPIVPGGNLKQMVSVHVPQGVTVVLDKYLESMVNKFCVNYDGPIFEIGVRNPVLWRTQLEIREVWTFHRFKKYLEKNAIDIDDIVLEDMISGCVLRNSIDCMNDKADTDGDLFPIGVPLDTEIQKCLREVRQTVNVKYDYEKEWLNEYIKGEVKKWDFADIQKKPFEFYTVSKEDFSIRFADSAIAKKDVGLGTVDMWKFHAAAEWLYRDGELSLDDMKVLQFIESRIIQDTIVEGIKHVEGGSSGYSIFRLSDYESNEEVIKEVLINQMRLTDDLARKFISCMQEANENDIVNGLCRLPGGAEAKTMAKLAKLMNTLPEHQQDISYARIMKDFIHKLGTQEEDEEIADDFYESITLYEEELSL